MASILALPKLGLTMTEGTVSKWNKKEGDLVTKGEILYEVATDKINNDVESTVSGVLLKILVPEGEKQLIKEPVAIIGESNEDISDILASLGSEVSSELKGDEREIAPIQEDTQDNVVKIETTEYIKASPLAKKRARELSISLSSVKGTGPGGRVVEKDILAVSSYAPASKMSPMAEKMADKLGVDPSGIHKNTRIMKSDVMKQAQLISEKDAGNLQDLRVPMSQMRKIIAERMVDSVRVSPAVHYQLRVDTTEMSKFREQKKSKSKITYTDMIVALTARVLLNHPLLNASVDGDEIILRNYVNMGVAVALEEGLMVPVIKNAHQKGFREIGGEIKELASKAKVNALMPDELSAGTFTITNMGMFGMESFTPIINQPEVAILGVNTIVDTPVSENGNLVFKPMMNLSLSADHRVVDGSVAAAFMKELKETIENPFVLLW